MVDFTFTFHFNALEKAMATHSSTLAWKIPWTEEPGGLQSMGLLGIRHHPPLAICDTMVNHKNLQKIYAAELTRTIQRKITTQSEYSVLCNFLKCLHGEGNGTPLQYCCLENPMDGGVW